MPMRNIFSIFLIALSTLLCASFGSAWSAAKFEDESISSKKKHYDFIDFEGEIPLLQKYTLSPSKPDILLTDTSIFEYPNCKISIQNNSHKYPVSSVVVKNYLSHLAVKDINNIIDFSDGNGDDGGMSSQFSMTINKAHMSCLSGDFPACKSIMTAMEVFASENAFTENTKFGNTPVSYFVTIHRFLKPLLAAYSTASQRLGRHSNDEQFKNWSRNAILQNTFNPTAPKGEKDRDLWREKAVNANWPKFEDMGQDPAQNHSLNSGMLAMMHGVLWLDEHMYQVGLDSYLITLSSIDKRGALPLEAIRGGSAIFYSGATINTLLQIQKIALGQGQNLGDLYPQSLNLHRAVNFILDVVEDESNILHYSRLNKIDQTNCQSFKQQCFHGTERDTAFGWVKLYLQIYPNHRNSKRIYDYYDQLKGRSPIEQKRKENLNAIIKGNFDHEPFRHNLTYATKWDAEDSYNFERYPQDTDWNLGSPTCLYSFSKRPLEGIYTYNQKGKLVLALGNGAFSQRRSPKIRQPGSKRRIKAKISGSIGSKELGWEYLDHNVSLVDVYGVEAVLFHYGPESNPSLETLSTHQSKISKACGEIDSFGDDKLLFLLETKAKDRNDFKHQKCVYKYFENSGDEAAFKLYRIYLHSAKSIGKYLDSLQ